MTSLFLRAMAAADRVQERTFGERVRITPQRVSEMRGASPDPDRTERTVVGVYTKAGSAERGRLDSARQGQKFNTLGTTTVAPNAVWLSAPTLAGLGYALAKGDLVTLLDRAGTPAFAIAQYLPSDVEDGTYPLVSA